MGVCSEDEKDEALLSGKQAPQLLIAWRRPGPYVVASWC
jgi:hypothetical protein